jgi:hypothetical protein
VTRACTRAHARVPECCSRGFLIFHIWHIYYTSLNLSLYKRTVLSVSLYVRYVRPRPAGSCTCRAGGGGVVCQMCRFARRGRGPHSPPGPRCRWVGVVQ